MGFRADAAVLAFVGLCCSLGPGCGTETIPLKAEGGSGSGSGSGSGGAAAARLDMLVWDAGEGAVMARGWHDRELAVDCDFAPAADGRYRCLPHGEGVADVVDLPVFADASCTVPAVVRPACAPPLTYLRAAPRPMPTCADLAAQPVFAVGDVLDTTTVYVQSGGCVAVPLEADSVVNGFGEEVSPSRFVGADLTPQGTGRLATYALVADDGSVNPLAIWDSELGECALGGDLAAPTCQPTETAWGVPPMWGDPACTERVAIDDHHERPCAAPTAARDPSAPASGTRLRVLGAALAVDEIYRKDDTGTCAPQAVELDSTYYSMGEELALEQLAPLGETTEGTGRVVVRRLTDGTGALLGPGTGFWDTELDEACAPLELADGYRCVGDFAPADLFFQDAACTLPVVLGDGQTKPKIAAVGHEPSNACDTVSVSELYVVGASVAVPMPYARDINGACYAPPGLPPEVVFYALGAPFDPPELAAR